MSCGAGEVGKGRGRAAGLLSPLRTPLAPHSGSDSSLPSKSPNSRAVPVRPPLHLCSHGLFSPEALLTQQALTPSRAQCLWIFPSSESLQHSKSALGYTPFVTGDPPSIHVLSQLTTVFGAPTTSCPEHCGHSTELDRRILCQSHQPSRGLPLLPAQTSHEPTWASLLGVGGRPPEPSRPHQPR